MSFAIRYERTLRHAAWVAMAACLVVCAILVMSYLSLPSSTDASVRGEGGALAWPVAPALAALDWSVFHSDQETVDASPVIGLLSDRFRLAGTFFWTGPIGGNQVRKAILDDLKAGSEHIVAEGDRLDDAEVLNVFQESIILRVEGREEELRLSYSGPTAGTASAEEQAEADWLNLAENEIALATNRFGALIAEGRWVMNRGRVEDYCREIEEHPARVIKLFDSMKPVYEYDVATGARQITGYHLDIEGEGDFYNDVGLRQGDIVQRVNLMPMTNKRRAMFWIEQFRGGQANAFMLDVVRDGQPVRLEYLVR